MDLTTYKEQYGKSKSRAYMSFENWFKQEVPDEVMRDYMRIEEAFFTACELFSLVDQIENDNIFEDLIGSTHDKADEISRELRDAETKLSQAIAKGMLNAYLSTTN